jgi:uncharacterized membrane-anchored protein
MRSGRTRLVLLLLLVLAAVPLGYAGWSELQLHRGRRVLLPVRPVDPIDPLRGEYVALRYPFSAADVAGTHAGDRLYVPLHRTASGVWTGGRATKSKPAHGIFLRGRVTHSWSGGASVHFGIESFYVHEGQARTYEDAIAARTLYADVVVGDDGRARLSKLVTRS